MQILITGGAGYIGAVLVRALSQDERVTRLVIFDNLKRSNYNAFFHDPISGPEVAFIQGDVLDSRILEKALKDIDVVYHLAANVSTPFASQDPHFFEQVNHWGTSDVVFAVENSDVQRFIFLSSASVYGASSRLIDEQYVPMPQTYYGISKLRAEEHVQRLLKNPDMRTYILRSGNVYGYSPTMRFDAVINRFMFEANFKGKISIYGTGHQNRSFIHIHQLVGFLTQFADADHIPAGLYNLTQRNKSVLEVAHAVKELYPDLEMQFINQHFNFRELRLSTDLKLYDYIEKPDFPSFDKELRDFQKVFAF